MPNFSIPFCAAFFEAVSTDVDVPTQRVQWLLPTAGLCHLGAQILAAKDGSGRFIKRRMERPGHRAKWQLTQSDKFETVADRLMEQLTQYESMGWELRTPVVIPIDTDDYQKLWSAPTSFTTPYKALRHVEAETKKRFGYRLTD